MLGLMQDWPLTVDRILDHARRWHGDREVVSRSVEGPIVRTTYARIHERAKRLTHALLALGVKPGDRVATLAWNTGRHMEVWYAVMGMGAVCHTLNPRLFVEQLCYIINHAQDRIIFVDLTFLPTLLANRDKMPSVERIVVMTDPDHMDQADFPGALCLESLIDQHSPDAAWGGFDENTACGLCYTSGTTGDPKGVLYSHRSNFLHALVTLQKDACGLSNRDSFLMVVPMFHANAWGVAFTAPAVGAKLVMPGARMDGEAIYELLETEAVTYSGAVPTVWQMLLQHLQATGKTLPTLKRILTGGSAVPESLVRAFENDYGVEVTHAWGMTETSPMGAISTPMAATADLPREEQFKLQLKQGHPPVGVDLKLTDDAGGRVAHDGRTFGRLKIKGASVARAYYRSDADILDGEGFFDTGDIATIDAYGFMQITDRAKDVIKSGGEWISSIEVENLAAAHPTAALTAVIGLPHPKWDERPLLVVQLKPGASATRADYLDFLEGKIAKWWLPDDVVFVEEIPLGGTGKIDKKRLRERFAGYRPPTG
jgi:fatty-acyl-CoA synthase